MKPFKHHNARSMKEATSLLTEYEGKARVNAGGTDLLGAMRDKCMAEYPEAVINIKGIAGLDYIKNGKKELRIGALTKLADIAGSSDVKKEYGLLAEAVYSVATPHIRNMATIGGNLAQEVRCWYYRYPAQIGGPIRCLRKGGKICSALGGDNRYHSLFGAAPMTEYPCSSNCPAATDIPGYLGLIRRGDLKGAAEVLMEVNPIPAITGRICPVFCEPQCNRKEFDESVAISCVERGAGDYILEHREEFYRAPEKESGKKVAIIGSGPAGLAAAFYLRREGHGVTIYEKLPEAGGMLRYSIPAFRLPKEVVAQQIEALKGMGITFRMNVEVGRDLSIKDLQKHFDVVFAAGGTWRPLRLGVAGEDAAGVHYALEYLKKINSGEKVPLGKRVMVIGGGSVAIDAARTAKRSGAEEVHLVCLECRDLTSKDRMLALENEIVEAEEEGIIIHGSLGVKEITVKNGKAAGLQTVSCLSVREVDGTFNPQYDMACTALDIEGESIIVAIGQGADASLPAPGLGYARSGTISVDPSTSETGVKGLFAGGDTVSGSTTVIQAVTSARKAVEGIISFLGGKVPVSDERERVFNDTTLREIPRVKSSELLPQERLKSIQVEDFPGVAREEWEREAQRCFNCGCLAVGPSDVALALVALDGRIITSKRSIPAAIFFSANATSSTILDDDELIKEIRVPKPPAGSVQRYEKFTLRKPIDFAVASVASVMTIKDGICKDIRIVLGAVAPEPLRAHVAEEFLKGRRLDEASARKAGELAVSGTVPLSMNSYKIEVAKTLVKRVIIL